MAKSSGGILGPLLLLGAGGIAVAALGAASRDREIDNAVLGQHRRACALLGIQPPPLVATAHVPNAASDGVRVFYNRSWFDVVLRRHCNDCQCRMAVVLGVIGHELGHHVSGHAADRWTHAWTKEVKADEISGSVLGRGGVSPDDFERVLAELSAYASETHPPAALRIDALRRGFWRALPSS